MRAAYSIAVIWLMYNVYSQGQSSRIRMKPIARDRRLERSGLSIIGQATFAAQRSSVCSVVEVEIVWQWKVLSWCSSTLGRCYCTTEALTPLWSDRSCTSSLLFVQLPATSTAQMQSRCMQHRRKSSIPTRSSISSALGPWSAYPFVCFHSFLGVAYARCQKPTSRNGP